jgi:glycosyltransferase involved in cell wall biosynthesis
MTDEARTRDVSLIVCTRDRVESLKSTITSFNSLVIPSDWTTELVVVDNGSTDGTAEYLLEATCALPIRTVTVREPGQTRARNAGMANSRGRVFVWTDDDVIADRDWLWKMAKPILEGTADAVAGRVVIPDQLRLRVKGTPFENRMSFLAETTWSNWDHPPRMVGASMAFGAHVLRKVPGFDERLGPGPHSLGFHDETTFCWQLLEAGYSLVGAHDAIINHHFDASRLDAKSICRIGARFGQSDAYVDWHWRHLPPKRLLWLRKLRSILKRRLTAVAANPADRLEGQFQEAMALAYYDEFARCMRQPRKYQRANK